MESYLPSFILMSSFLLNNSLWFSVLASSARISVRINAPDISSSRIMITNFHQIIFKIISVACDQDNCQDKTVWSMGLFSLSDSLLAPLSSVQCGRSVIMLQLCWLSQVVSDYRAEHSLSSSDSCCWNTSDPHIYNQSSNPTNNNKSTSTIYHFRPLNTVTIKP